MKNNSENGNLLYLRKTNLFSLKRIKRPPSQKNLETAKIYDKIINKKIFLESCENTKINNFGIKIGNENKIPTFKHSNNTCHYFLNQTKTTENKVLYPNKTILLVGILYLDAQMNFIRTCTSKTK